MSEHPKPLAPELDVAFAAAVRAAVAKLKQAGASKAYICERSFEIEDAAREEVMQATTSSVRPDNHQEPSSS